MSEVRYGRPAVPLNGIVRMPASKSVAHRAILAAALTTDEACISNLDMNRDIEATLRAAAAMGRQAEYSDGVIRLAGKEAASSLAQVDCGESGSTLRFIIPIFAALGMETEFIGSGRLPQRPIGIYEELLSAHGVEVETGGGLPLKISGKLQAGSYSLPGNVSSQFITGLMYALPLLEGDSEILLSTDLESEGYVNLTTAMLKESGIEIKKIDRGWHIKGGQKFGLTEYSVEGDWSHAAFFMSCAAVNPGSDIVLTGLRQDSGQGDIACMELYRTLGLHISEDGENNIRLMGPEAGLRAIDIDAAQIPDLVPALAVAASLAKGRTRIYNAGRLRIKESDRLSAISQAINSLGGRVTELEDELLIEGVRELKGGRALGQNDHRIVMALSASVLNSKADVTVSDAESIEKSYPHFFEDYKAVGGRADVV